MRMKGKGKGMGHCLILFIVQYLSADGATVKCNERIDIEKPKYSAVTSCIYTNIYIYVYFIIYFKIDVNIFVLFIYIYNYFF